MSCTKQFYYLHIGSFKFIAYIGETNNKSWTKPRLNIRLKDNIFPKFNCSVVTVVCVFKVWSRAIFFVFNLNRGQSSWDHTLNYEIDSDMRNSWKKYWLICELGTWSMAEIATDTSLSFQCKDVALISKLEGTRSITKSPVIQFY